MDYKALNGICEEYAQKAVEWRRNLHRQGWKKYIATGRDLCYK